MKIFKINILFFLLGNLCFLGIQCKNQTGQRTSEIKIKETENRVSIEKEIYGTTSTGKTVEKYKLRNHAGMEVAIITYGGRIVSLKVPDKKGEYEDVVLGFESLDNYTKNNPFFGALIGRYGNRIAKGKFSLDGKDYILAKNNGENHLHGGTKGFDKVIWTVGEYLANGTNSLKLSYTSKDMEEGYPGNLKVTVTYTLTDSNSLEVLYQATTDKKTVLNLTQHSHFNLTGDFSKKILDTEVKINADAFLPIKENLIPTGEIRKVSGTPFDFRTAKSIKTHIMDNNEQLRKANGYDHCWVLNEQGVGIRFAASAYDPGSGRLLEVFTDQPGMQLYTCNSFDGTFPAQGGGTYGKHSGFCMETQHYPDSPNQKSFPSVELGPSEQYISETIFRFSVK